MNWKSLAHNASVAFLAQGIAMGLSIVQTLLVPKLLGATQYGYWQLFIFYVTYVGLGHLGLNDGVYLIKGGQTRDEIDKRSVNSQFVFGMGFQLVIALTIVALAVFGGFGPDREFVITCTGIYLLIQNAANYFSYLLQAMNETKLSSYSKIVERLTFLAPLVVLLVVRYQSYQPFVISYMVSSLVQFFFCLWFCRDFIRAGLEPLPRAASDSWQSIRVGFKLATANIVSQLILGIARFAIDAAWGIETFGELSLALSLVSFFLQFVMQASMVLFPALRQAGSDEVKRFFDNSRDLMSLLFPLLYLLYFPMVWLLGLWLPKYANSFIYFAFLIPICVFDSKMNICCTTFFKVLRKEAALLKVNLLTCLGSAVLTLVGIFVFHSIYFVICGVVVAIIGRSVGSEIYLARDLDVPSGMKLTVGEIALTVVFVVSTFALPQGLAIILYCLVYGAFLFVFRDRLTGLVGKMRKLA